MSQQTSDEQAIKTLLEDWAAAVRRHDLPAILTHHDPEMIMFDLPPPLQCKGIAAYEETWGLLFQYHQPGTAFDIQEATVTAGSDVAFVVATMRCTEAGANGERQRLEFRLTVGLCKIGDQWTITHEHHSVPAED